MNKNKLFCSECEQYVNYTVKPLKKSFQVKDEWVTATIQVSTCNICGNEVFNRKLEIENDIKVFDAYKTKKGLLTTNEIKQIRDRYRLSQATFSKLLGFGEKTITRYESGSIQDRTHDNLMRLLKRDENMIVLYKLNIKSLSSNEQKKIGDYFNSNFNDSYTFEYNIEEWSQLKYSATLEEGDDYDKQGC